MPIYNEAETIEEIVARVQAVPMEKELILVDDCSTDGTHGKLLALEPGSQIKFVRHDKNRGKGAALRTGFALATGDFVIVQDADLEYDPRDYSKLLQPILEGKADVVYGSRLKGGVANRPFYFRQFLGNRFLTLFSNYFTNLDLTDMQTCYKVFRREVLHNICIAEDRFGFEPEITAKVAALGYRVYEVGISYEGRTYEEGKKIGWRDGVRALYCIVKYSSRTA